MDNKLASYPIPSLLLRYAAPSIFAMGASAIYNLCDSIFIGNYVGTLALSAMALTFPLMSLLGAIGSMLNIGGASQTAVMMGRNDKDQATAILNGVMKLGLCTGVAVTILGMLFLKDILYLMGATDATLPLAMSYMKIILPGMIITHTMQGMCGQLRATGNPNTAMRVQVTSVLMNILLDVLFIPILGFGIQGAAIATVLAQAIAWCIAAYSFTGGRCWIQFSTKTLGLKFTTFKAIMNVGISPLIMNLCGCFVGIIINHSLLHYGGEYGDMGVGVYGIQNRITALLIMCVAGFGQGMQPIVGYNLGAGNSQRVKEALVTCIKIATVIMFVGYILILIFANQLAGMFTDDETMISLSAMALRISLFTLPLVGVQMVAQSYFQAIRKAQVTIRISLSRQLFFLIPMLLILPYFIGLNGVWLAMPVADLMAFGVVLHYIRLGKHA